MKLLLIISVFVFVHSECYSQLIKVSDVHYRAEYQTKEGKMNGEYISFYHNGTLKAKGNFKNNVRTGIWTVYDTLGRKVHERNYSQDFLSFQKLFPEKEKTGPASLFDTSFYHAIKNKEGIIPYYELKERAVLFSSRIWRNIPQKQNKIFYDKNLLYQTIYNFVTDSSNLSYCSSDENFTKQLFPSQLKKYSTKDYKIIDYKIKEDLIFDGERMVSESRIIGICPVAINLKTKDTSDLFWAYFPYLRKPFSQVATKIKNEKGETQSLDDLFFFRNFSSVIYKRSNAEDVSIKDYAKTSEKQEKERNRVEVEMIEAEHQFWMGFLPY